MTMTATPVFPQTIKNYAVQILPADTTTKKTLCAGATNGTRIEAITIASTDTAARDVQFFLYNGTTSFLLATVAVPANSGNTSLLPQIDALRGAMTTGFSYDANGNRNLLVMTGWTLQVAVLTTVTTAKEVDIVCTAAGDY